MSQELQNHYQDLIQIANQINVGLNNIQSGDNAENEIKELRRLVQQLLREMPIIDDESNKGAPVQN